MTDDRATNASEVLRGLIMVSRRGIADARSADVSLSMTDQSILGFIVDNPGSRSTDIAAAFQLNRSTVSRQLAGLIRLGIVREVTTGAGRGRPLELTRGGQAGYEKALRMLQGIVDERLDAWPDDDIEAFARHLTRFNSQQDSTPNTKEEKTHD